FLNGKVLFQRWYVVIGCCRCTGWVKNGYTTFPDPGKGLWTGHFVNEMTVDVQHIGMTLTLLYYVCIPDFVEQCFRLAHVSFKYQLLLLKYTVSNNKCLFALYS